MVYSHTEQDGMVLASRFEVIQERISQEWCCGDRKAELERELMLIAFELVQRKAENGANAA